MPRVTLLGLPEDLARQLAQVLREEGHKVVHKIHLQDLRHGPKPDAVFISGDDPQFRRIIAELRESGTGLPVIVVTRRPGTAQWLDALDAGANDYCGAPFERVQVQWILDSAVRAEACAA
jgi:DNA-binding response OmpR family regulator